MNQRHLVLFSTTPLPATSSQSTRARLLVPTGYFMVGWFWSPDKEAPAFLRPLSNLCASLRGPMGLDKEQVLEHTMQLGSPAIWIGGLEHSLDVILSFGQPRLTDSYPQTSCWTTKIVVICRTEETRDQDLLGHYKSSNK